MYCNTYCSKLGPMTMASDGTSLTGLWFNDQKNFPTTLKVSFTHASLPIFLETCHWLDAYFAGENPSLSIPILPAGTPFRQEIWKLLQQIPYGTTVTYGDLAQKIARLRGRERMSAQAVGQAVGHNPVAILIPCHRVLAAAGRLTGYAGGLARKSWLLNLEKLGQNCAFF